MLTRLLASVLNVRRRPLISRFLGVYALSIVALLYPGAGRSLAASDEGALEHEIKAAMLYKFLSYIEWPAETFGAGAPGYRLWVLKADSVEEELRQITSERAVNSRPIKVVHARTAAGVRGPHLVFVGQRAESALPALAELARRQCLLIVTESEWGLPEGSSINLRLVNGRMGFDVALPESSACDLKLSSRLLSVATSVKAGDR